MNILQRLAITTSIVSSLVILAPSPAQGQHKYPTKPIRLVVAFSAGGVPDTLSRLVAPRMSDTWGQPLVIENRSGGGGTLAATLVARAAPDGYTLLATSSAFAIAAALRSDLPYDPLKDFAGVTEIGYGTGAVVVTPSLGVKSVKELIALSHAKPGFLLFGSAGAGSGTYMAAERFKFAAGIKAQHVGFKGQPEFVIEIVAGRVHFGSSGLIVSLPFIRDGRLMALVVNTPQRSPLLPDVPTAAEVLPGWGRDGSIAWLAPAATPRAIRNKISEEMRRVLALPEVKERLENIGFHITPSTPEEHERNLRADIQAFAKVVTVAGLKPK